MSQEILNEQIKVVKKLGIEPFLALPKAMLGIHLDKNKMPINALRHQPEGSGSGWFIWSGNEEIPQDNNFFEIMHVEHILEKYPEIGKYLALPPGWRFQIDDKGYEDIWFDDSLLKVS